MDILQRIINLRNEKGWTNYRLREEAGLAPATLTNMFSRGTLPSIATLTSICSALGISLSQFFCDTEEIILSTEEQEIILLYRQLNKKDKNIINKLLKEMN